MKKLLSLLLAASLLVHPLLAQAMPYDEYIAGRTAYKTTSTVLSPGLSYAEVQSANDRYGTEYAYIYTYTPGQGTVVVPADGGHVYGTEALRTITRSLENDGKRVVGGINGDFYSMETGVPLGVMIADGEIYTSDNDRAALGFDADGKAFISRPNIRTTLSNGEKTVNVEHINKYPLEYALYLLTDRFGKTTQTTKLSAEIVLMPYREMKELPPETETEPGDDFYFQVFPPVEEPSETEDTAADEEIEQDEPAETDESSEPVGEEPDESAEPEEAARPAPVSLRRYIRSDEVLSVGCELKLVVTELRTDSKNSPIPEGCFVLCAENVEQYPRVADLHVGDGVTLTVTADEPWEKAVSAIGNSGGSILRDGEYVDDVEIDHYAYANPRTAAGITADGRVIFYCVDGRVNPESHGLRIDQLSHEMKLLGCVDAINFDGGGSTTAYAALPGEMQSVIRNIPSDGSERHTANSLVFINTLPQEGKIARLFLSPDNPLVFPGGSTTTLGKLRATDENYYPKSLPGDYVVSRTYFTDPAETDSFIDAHGRFVSGEKTGEVTIYSYLDEKNTIRVPVGTVTVTDAITDFSIQNRDFVLPAFGSTEPLSYTASAGPVPITLDPGSLSFDLSGTVTDENIDGFDFSTLHFEQLGIGPLYGTRDETPADTSGDISDKSVNDSPKTVTGILSSDLVYTPTVYGETCYIVAKAGEHYVPIRIESHPFPFADSLEHWSAPYLAKAYDCRLMQGELVDDELAFFPSRTITKAEFLTVLARILDPELGMEDTDLSAEELPTEELTAEELTDGESFLPEETEQAVLEEDPVPAVVLPYSDEDTIPSWARRYFESLADTDLLTYLAIPDGADGMKLYPNEPISRMEVMTLLGALCPHAEEDRLSPFTDPESFASAAYPTFLNNAAASGLFEGYEDGSIRADRSLTRAEAATVILRFFELMYQNL